MPNQPDDLADNSRMNAEGRDHHGDLPPAKKDQLTIKARNHADAKNLTSKNSFDSFAHNSHNNLGLSDMGIAIVSGKPIMTQMAVDELCKMILSDYKQNEELKCPDCGKIHLYRVPGANYKDFLGIKTKCLAIYLNKTTPNKNSISVDLPLEERFKRWGNKVIEFANEIFTEEQKVRFHSLLTAYMEKEEGES